MTFKSSLSADVPVADDDPLQRRQALEADRPEPDKPVGLNVSFSKLEDGTSYVSKIDLQDPSADIEVQVANTGYQKLEQDQD
jgi:hypothetical protein